MNSFDIQSVQIDRKNGKNILFFQLVLCTWAYGLMWT
jgi:hypothetical protein